MRHLHRSSRLKSRTMRLLRIEVDGTWGRSDLVLEVWIYSPDLIGGLTLNTVNFEPAIEICRCGFVSVSNEGLCCPIGKQTFNFWAKGIELAFPIAVSLRKEMLVSRQILRKNQEQTSHETYYSKSDAKGIG
jgi:hypothetical protein